MRKKLQKMGASAYFLMTKDDRLQLALETGNFYDVEIKGIGTITKLLKFYGASTVFAIGKKDFDSFNKLKIGTEFDLDIKLNQSTAMQTDFTKNPHKLKKLVKQVDELHANIHSIADAKPSNK